MPKGQTARILCSRSMARRISPKSTPAKAEALYHRSEIEKLFLLPLEFGGQDFPENVWYVPSGNAQIRAEIDHNLIRLLIAAGKVTQYTATPEYQGKSFIPIAIRIVASDPGEFF